MNRSRLFAYAAVVACVLIASIVVDWWLFVHSGWGPAAISVALLAQGLAVAGLVFGMAATIETRLLRPIRLLHDHLRLITHTDYDHRLNLPENHGLGELPDRVAALGLQLARARHDTARAMASAVERIDIRRARLEAILRDLSEGVLVCTNTHRVVLFNQSAAGLLQHAAPVGLHRGVQGFFTDEAVSKQFERLVDLYRTHGRNEIAQFKTSIAREGAALAVRMSLVIEPNKSCAGYVLSFAPADGNLPAPAASGANILADRPEFYDFSLFDRAPAPVLHDRPLAELDYIVFDTETTGLNPSYGDEIVQIAGARVVNQHIQPGDEFDVLVNPGFPIPPQSIRFHGITDDMVVAAPRICEALNRFHRFVDNAVLVAHNAAFDMKFIRLKEAQCEIRFDHPILDTLLLSVVLNPDETSHSLDTIALRFGVHIPAAMRHTAIGDARATAEIFVRMLPVLQAQGITTLQAAIDASNQIFSIRRQQQQF
jgi:DNA polymerase III subunit epsilon